MWASTSDFFEDGRRYSVKELGALIYPLDMLIDMARNLTPKGAFCQPILQRMELGEVTFSLYELFKALLEDIPIPDGGHPGYQGALISELLVKMHACIEMELELDGRDDEMCDDSRMTAWKTFLQYIPEFDEEGRPYSDGWLEDRGVSPNELFPWLSPDLDSEDWQDLLESVAGEFLADRDWELEVFLDRAAGQTAELREMMGLDLDRVHCLPHTPTSEELARAKQYLDGVIRAFERSNSGYDT